MIPELEIVALTCDLPEEGLRRADTGTIVFVLPPRHYIVEFMTEEGETVAVVTVSQDQIQLVAPDKIQYARVAESSR